MIYNKYKNTKKNNHIHHNKNKHLKYKKTKKNNYKLSKDNKGGNKIDFGAILNANKIITKTIHNNPYIRNICYKFTIDFITTFHYKNNEIIENIYNYISSPNFNFDIIIKYTNNIGTDDIIKFQNIFNNIKLNGINSINNTIDMFIFTSFFYKINLKGSTGAFYLLKEYISNTTNRDISYIENLIINSFDGYSDYDFEILINPALIHLTDVQNINLYDHVIQLFYNTINNYIRFVIQAFKENNTINSNISQILQNINFINIDQYNSFYIMDNQTDDFNIINFDSNKKNFILTRLMTKRNYIHNPSSTIRELNGELIDIAIEKYNNNIEYLIQLWNKELSISNLDNIYIYVNSLNYIFDEYATVINENIFTDISKYNKNKKRIMYISKILSNFGNIYHQCKESICKNIIKVFCNDIIKIDTVTILKLYTIIDELITKHRTNIFETDVESIQNIDYINIYNITLEFLSSLYFKDIMKNYFTLYILDNKNKFVDNEKYVESIIDSNFKNIINILDNIKNISDSLISQSNNYLIQYVVCFYLNYFNIRIQSIKENSTHYFVYKLFFNKLYDLYNTISNIDSIENFNEQLRDYLIDMQETTQDIDNHIEEKTFLNSEFLIGYSKTFIKVLNEFAYNNNYYILILGGFAFEMHKSKNNSNDNTIDSYLTFGNDFKTNDIDIFLYTNNQNTNEYIMEQIIEYFNSFINNYNNENIYSKVKFVKVRDDLIQLFVEYYKPLNYMEYTTLYTINNYIDKKYKYIYDEEYINSLKQTPNHFYEVHESHCIEIYIKNEPFDTNNRNQITNQLYIESKKDMYDVYCQIISDGYDEARHAKYKERVDYLYNNLQLSQPKCA